MPLGLLEAAEVVQKVCEIRVAAELWLPQVVVEELVEEETREQSWW